MHELSKPTELARMKYSNNFYKVLRWITFYWETQRSTRRSGWMYLFWSAVMPCTEGASHDHQTYCRQTYLEHSTCLVDQMWADANCFVSTWTGVLAILLILSEDTCIESQTRFNASADPWRRLPIDEEGSQACGAFRSDGQDAGTYCIFDFASLRQRWPCAWSSDWSYPRDAARGVWKYVWLSDVFRTTIFITHMFDQFHLFALVWKCLAKKHIKPLGKT